jgi:putative serine protease PepD
MSRVRLILCLPVLCALGEQSNADDLAIAAKAERGDVVQINVQSGGKSSVGSGVWVSDDGYVATCFHVVSLDSPVSIKVMSSVDSLFDLERNSTISGDWVVREATIAGTDQMHDVVILKVSPNPFKEARVAVMKIDGVEYGSHYDRLRLMLNCPSQVKQY